MHICSSWKICQLLCTYVAILFGKRCWTNINNNVTFKKLAV